MFSALSRWNRWGGRKLPSGIPRQVTQKIIPLIKSKNNVVLTGPRRAGKTTVLFQLMQHLEDEKIPCEAMLYVNFEDPALAPYLTTQQLDLIYNDYREKIFPKGKAYLFLDGISHVSQWENWVRAYHETEDIKIFLTSAAATLTSHESDSFIVNPLNFSEYLQFQNIAIPKKPFALQAPHEIRFALEKYLRWGGLPEIVLSESDEHRELLLKHYLDELLFKDICLRYEIRDVVLLRQLAVYLLTQTANLVSYHRIGKQFNISMDKAQSYCTFLKDAFLVDYLPFYSLKITERNRQPFKVHAVDLGLHHIVTMVLTDNNRLMETATCHHLKNNYQEPLYYWADKEEVSFLRCEENTVVELIQVSEKSHALSAAKAAFPKAASQLIVNKIPKNIENNTTPLWSYLL